MLARETIDWFHILMGSCVVATARGGTKSGELVPARYAPIKCAQPGCQRY